MNISIVEDDRIFNRMIQHAVGLLDGYKVKSFLNGSDFIKTLDAECDVVTLDLGLPDMTGEEILKRIKKISIDTEVIIISGQDNVKMAVQLLKLGAFDYITKDENIKDRLLHCLNKIADKKNLKKQITQLKNEITGKQNFGELIIGDSKPMANVFELIKKSIRIHNITISIYGETGTGKELIAHTIHQESSRKDKPFVAVNMGAIPRDLIESELFGHEKGAFTGAYMTRKGKFEEADGGTLFLDEISEMDLDLQVRLLRVVQEREITHVGGNHPVKVNCRIITATNKKLADEVKAGHFREDLYYRLMGLPIFLPPLTERQGDIILLCNHFLEKFCIENTLPTMSFSHSAKKRLLSHSYPGNVRELKAIVELSAVLSNEPIISEEHVIFNSSEMNNGFFAENRTLKEYNQIIINHYLESNHQDVLKVAKLLEIGKSTIYNMLNNNHSKTKLQ